MAGRKKRTCNNKRKIALVLYASNNELASLIKDSTMPFEDRIVFGKKKSLRILRKLFNEMVQSYQQN